MRVSDFREHVVYSALGRDSKLMLDRCARPRSRRASSDAPRSACSNSTTSELLPLNGSTISHASIALGGSSPPRPTPVGRADARRAPRRRRPGLGHQRPERSRHGQRLGPIAVPGCASRSWVSAHSATSPDTRDPRRALARRGRAAMVVLVEDLVEAVLSGRRSGGGGSVTSADGYVASLRSCPRSRRFGGRLAHDSPKAPSWGRRPRVAQVRVGRRGAGEPVWRWCKRRGKYAWCSCCTPTTS